MNLMMVSFSLGGCSRLMPGSSTFRDHSWWARKNWGGGLSEIGSGLRTSKVNSLPLYYDFSPRCHFLIS